MKYQIALPACVLLLWTLTAFVSCQGTDSKDEHKVKVMTVPEGIKLSCLGGLYLKGAGENIAEVTLAYSDENSGEYQCFSEREEVSIYVKFRTCDNCIELDIASIMGIAIGEVVATIAIGVAVYLIASHAQTAPIKSYKKGPHTQGFVPNEGSSRPSANEHYQPLRHGGQKDTYDMIKNRRA